MTFFNNHFDHIVGTIIVTLLIIILRYILTKLVKRYAKYSELLEYRINLVIKYISIILTILYFLAIAIIWGVKSEDLFFTVSSVITVIGIAFFAQWSILSNITSGFILLFSFPFKIGDTIKIHDKDFPVEGEIIDIRTFHTLIKTAEEENITYPNSLLLQKGISIVIKDIAQKS